jgi:hypothetical protein
VYGFVRFSSPGYVSLLYAISMQSSQKPTYSTSLSVCISKDTTY